MFLTKECDYAIRVVRGLADMEIKSVKTVCAAEHIPHLFAYKILKKLERSGIAEALRGVAGGYRLIKTPEEITLLDIVAAVDDRLLLTECLHEGYACEHNSNGKACAVRAELCRLQDILVGALGEKPVSRLFPAASS